MARRTRVRLPRMGGRAIELDAEARAEAYRTCCQSLLVHRFDCAAAPPEQRGKGPFGPVAPATSAELVARLRA